MFARSALHKPPLRVTVCLREHRLIICRTAWVRSSNDTDSRPTSITNQVPVAVFHVLDPVGRTPPARPGCARLRIAIFRRHDTPCRRRTPAPSKSENIPLSEPVVGNLGPDVSEYLFIFCRPGRCRLLLERGHLCFQFPECRHDLSPGSHKVVPILARFDFERLTTGPFTARQIPRIVFDQASPLRTKTIGAAARRRQRRERYYAT